MGHLWCNTFGSIQMKAVLSGIHLQDWPKQQKFGKELKEGGSYGTQSKKKKVTYCVIDICFSLSFGDWL